MSGRNGEYDDVMVEEPRVDVDGASYGNSGNVDAAMDDEASLGPGGGGEVDIDIEEVSNEDGDVDVVFADAIEEPATARGSLEPEASAELDADIIEMDDSGGESASVEVKEEYFIDYESGDENAAGDPSPPTPEPEPVDELPQARRASDVDPGNGIEVSTTNNNGQDSQGDEAEVIDLLDTQSGADDGDTATADKSESEIDMASVDQKGASVVNLPGDGTDENGSSRPDESTTGNQTVYYDADDAEDDTDESLEQVEQELDKAEEQVRRATLELQGRLAASARGTSTAAGPHTEASSDAQHEDSEDEIQAAVATVLADDAEEAAEAEAEDEAEAEVESKPAMAPQEVSRILKSTPVVFAFKAGEYPLVGDGVALLDSVPTEPLTIEQLFDVVRVGISELPENRELFFYFPQLGLRIGEDNIYARDANVVDLINLLAIGAPRDDALNVHISHADRFITQFNDLFEQLADLPPAKRQKRE